MYSCWQGLWGIICCLSLLLGMASCQDFTDDTGRTMPEPDLKFADGTLNPSVGRKGIYGGYRIQSALACEDFRHLD